MKNRKMNQIIKILSNSIIVILSILLILVIYGSMQLNVFNKEYVNIFGYSFFEVQTGSMKPNINIKDIVIVKIEKVIESIEEQDIITYKKDNNLITHRVIEKQENKIITKGDNNNTIDEPISIDNVVGKVVYVFKDILVWKKVFSDSKVIILSLVTISLLILIITYKEKDGEKNVRKKENS